ncbi:MAG: chromate transporter [Clostridia bacterium]|nr:chromate transporter [Clostridia bacterium]
MKLLLDLYLVFFRMGIVCFGGGYALLPIIQREVVDKRGYATAEEINDYFAIGQCTPGVISVNVATFVGYKQKGIAGGIVATLGFITPSILIIAIVAAFISNFADIQAVRHAFSAIRVCVCVLIIEAVLKFRKSSVIDILTAVICIAVFIAASFTDVSPVILVIFAGAAGVIYKKIGGKH